MRFLLVALLFLFAVAGVTVGAKYGYRGAVENELEARATGALQNGGFSGIEVSIDHLNGTLTGFVDSEEEKQRALEILAAAVPTAYFPESSDLDLSIRPTLPPWISIVRTAGTDVVTIEGLLAASDDASRMLLGARLHALDEIASVDNQVDLDAKRLPFTKTAELASLSSSFVSNSQATSIVFRDGKLSLEGRVANDGLKSSLLELAEQIEADSLVDKIAVAEPVSFRRPSFFVMTRNRFGVTLNGILGSKRSEEKIVTTIESATPEVALVNKIKISDAISPGVWEDHVSELFPESLGNLDGEMTVSLSNDEVRISGTALSPGADQKIALALRPLIEKQPSLRVITNIKPSPEGAGKDPVTITAVLEPGLLTLEGSVPVDTFVATIENLIEANDLEILVKNALTVGEAIRDEQWIDNLGEFFAEVVSRTETGTFRLEGERFTMEGATVALSDRQILQNVAVNTLPSGFSIENQLVHRDQPFPKPLLSPEDTKTLAESMAEFPIYFDTNSETVNKDGADKIKAMSNLIEESAGKVDLVMTGFADNVGNAEYNRQLSLKRAQAVIDAFIALGFDAGSMTVESKGEDGSGLSRSQKWKARRVEVSPVPITTATVE